jgi:hypothetical protein
MRARAGNPAPSLRRQVAGRAGADQCDAPRARSRVDDRRREHIERPRLELQCRPGSRELPSRGPVRPLNILEPIIRTEDGNKQDIDGISG